MTPAVRAGAEGAAVGSMAIDGAGVPAVLVELAALYVLIAMLLAAWAKTSGFVAFRRSLADAFPAMAPVAAGVGAAIVAAEWTIALALLAGGAPARAGMAAALGLLALFTTVVGGALVTGRAITCTCFGAAGHRIGGIDLARNLALTAAAAIVVLSPHAGLPWAPAQRAILAGVALCLVIASVRARDLVWLLRAGPEG